MRLGQHFLKSKKIVEIIVKAAEINKTDTVLEVGPGKGILTEQLVKRAKRVIAVEKDKELVEFLKQKFKNCENLELIHGDILKLSRSDLARIKIVANIPYYITSRFLRLSLSAKNQPAMMVLMLQKEVAKRIVSKPPKMNLLTISVQVYAKPQIIKSVSKKYFSPQPKVDSAIIKIDNISRKFFRGIDEKKFFELVKEGFSHKRKLLKNNLDLLDTRCLIDCGVSPKARAQELSLEQWKCLHKKQNTN